jgi:hypothetical protein
MTVNIRCLMPALTATAGAFLATAFLSSAFAHADPNTFVVIPDPEDGPSALTAVGGIAPFDTTISYSGVFVVDFGGSSAGEGVFGNATYYSDIFGLHNVELQGEFNGVPTQVIDDLSFGNGYDNVYTDMIGAGPDGSNSITDIFVTPFGDFNVPTTYDAAADFPTPLGAAALDTDFTSFAAALDADWTTLVTDFGALF